MNKMIDQLLLKSGIAINNGLDNSEIAGYLAEYGYSAERITEGKTVHTTASQYNQQQTQEQGEQIQATIALNGALEAAKAPYMKYVTIGRIAFRKFPGIMIKLELTGDRKQSYSGWTSQANIFYSNLLADADALAKMSEFGVTSEKLLAGQALVTTVEEKLAAQKKEIGEAQNATKERDQAIDQLQEWYSDYIEIARIALEEHPQYLEILGIIEPS